MIGRFPSKLSLEWKLPAVIGGLLLLVIVALSSAAFIEARREAQAAAGDRLSNVTQQLAALLTTSGRQLVSRTQAIADKAEVRSYLLAPSAKGRPAAIRALRDVGPQPEQMMSVGLYDATGHRLLAEGPGASRIDTAAARELLAAAVARDSGVVERFRTMGDTIIYPTLAPVHEGKKKIGYVVMWRRLTSTPQGRQQMAGLLGADAALYLGNADGSIWSDLVQAVPPPPVPVKPAGVLTYGRPGVGTRLAAARLVPGTPWIVLVEFAGSLVSAPARAFLRTLILISLTLFAIGMAAAWFVSRRITGPLRNLTDAAGHISVADFSARVPVDGEDELGKLAGAFNEMAARIEEAQRAEQDRFRVLIEAVTDYAILVLDPDGRVATWNGGAERLKGYTPEEIIGRNFSSFYPADDIAAGKPEKLLAAAASEGLTEDEGWRVRKDGSRFWAHVSITALRNQQGKLLGFGKVTRDMTDRRRTEEELKRSNAALEAFGYSVAHDLRAPLRAVDGFSKALLEDFGSQFPKEAQGLLDTILQSTRRMGQMIEGLLSFSRLGQKSLDVVPLNPGDLVRSVVEELRAAQSPDAEVVLHDMPPIRADRTLMRQVLQNLISNALKFSRDRAHPRVEIGSMVGDGEVSIYVRDNGVGFDGRYADKLFGVFQRLHPVDQFEGNGVGLALVRRIVERHSGRVWAESQNGSGATFYFTLPQG